MKHILTLLAVLTLAPSAMLAAAEASASQPVMSDVFVAGQDGVHTYRIPAVVLSPSGAVLVFCEARKEGIRDASPTDMVLKRSLDGGKTWLPAQTLVRGEGTDALMNPVAVVDRATGVVFLLCCNTNRKTRGEHRRHLLLSSSDDGHTWSAPADIGGRIAGYDDTFVPGPGCGIQTRSGRLVMPGYTSPEKIDAQTEEGFRARVIYSDDGGKSWRMGQPVDNHTNESQVVELADGRLMLNMRQGAGRSCRAVATSQDGGEAWGPVSFDRALNECPCQASILRHESADKDGRSVILFANPDNAGARYGVVERTRMTVRISYDEARTWPVKKLIHAGPSSYSGLVRFSNGDVGLVFEGGEKHRREWIRFLRLPLARLAADKAAEPGLVAHWTFDEGRGDIAKDITGHGHDATLKDIAWTPSPRGHAIRFDRKESLARYGAVDSMNLSGDMTLAVWVKTDAAVEPGKTHLIFGDTGLGVQRNLTLYLDGRNGLRFEWANGTENDWLTAPAAELNGSWKHVAVVADSRDKQVAIYVDGEEMARKASTMPISKAPVKERLTGWFYNGFFQGDLDDIRLYNRALSADEIRQLFVAQADLQVGVPTVQFDASKPEPRGIASVKLHNWSKQERLLELESATVAKRQLALLPGAQTEVTLGQVALRPVWRNRTDLFVCQQPQEGGKTTVAVHRGNAVERSTLGLAPQSVLEPIRAQVKDPWQREMTPGKTERLELELQFAIPAEQLRQGTLHIRLAARQTGQEVLRQHIQAPQTRQSLTLDVRALPWGAYDLRASFHDGSGREVVSTNRVATILPDGKQQIRVLNNLVSELMDARARGLLKSQRIEFMNPREGWVWFYTAGNCALTLGADRLPAGEAMRLLPAGRHAVQVAGTPTELTIRAIPALVYNVYPSTPRITPFGSNTWERLRKHTLPNSNMIESSTVDTPEHKEWLAQGKLWLTNVQAPGLIDKKEWTAEKLLEVWLKPGTSTAHAERPGLELSKLSGVQVDEYYPGAQSTRFLAPLAHSIAQLAEHPAFAGKLWIPFLAGRFGATPDNLLMKTLLGSGWPFSEEVYVGEMPTEAENASSIRSSFLHVATAYEGAHPGSLRRMIFTPMYAYLPYCTTNRYAQADFRVHLDMQMQVLAADPAFFGLWGVQPYRSNYVDEEILNCMGRLLRHYCIEGKTGRMLTDPYELRHVADPDFAAGTKHWQIAAAEKDAVDAGQFAGYGAVQGRYPAGAFGDTFLLLKRSARGPNVVSQQLQGLQPGRLYSLKLITGDYIDLNGGKTRRDPQAISIKLDGAEVLAGGFSYPFPSARGPKPFTREAPFWMTYHWLQFRAKGPTARLAISDWKDAKTPGGPIGQQMMCSFVEVQPVLTD